MGSTLGPLLANVFMSSLEEKLKLESKLPDYYRRYVDDTLTIMPNITTATDFLNTLNHAHPSVSFTMEIEKDGLLPFLGTQLLNRAPQIETKVYVKPTNTGLLVHYQSHVDNRCKRSLLTTMLDRAYRLSSSSGLLSESVYAMFCKVRCLFILARQVFETCWLEEGMATKVFIPRVITHFTHLQFLLHKETLYVYDETNAVLDSQIHRSISFFKRTNCVLISFINRQQRCSA